jgi:hypothetical protein
MRASTRRPPAWLILALKLDIFWIMDFGVAFRRRSGWADPGQPRLNLRKGIPISGKKSETRLDFRV